MAAWSDYAEGKIADHVFRGIAWTAPATLYFALFTAGAGDAGGGTELTGGNYARVGVAANSTNFTSAGTNGTVSNANVIAFPVPSANWGTVNAMALFDAATGGNLIGYSALNTPRTISNGDPAPSFAAGAFTFQIDN